MSEIQTLSVLVGGRACNASCPFCISKITHEGDVPLKAPEVNWRRLDVAKRIATRKGVVTAMLTSKGEPTLWPGLIEQYLGALSPEFPIIELQNNGKALSEMPEEQIWKWTHLGLTTVAISMVHWRPNINRDIYFPKDRTPLRYDDLIKKLHDCGLSVRITCTMYSGGIDNIVDFRMMIQYARNRNVEQLTFTPVNTPDDTDMSLEALRWAKDHALPDSYLRSLDLFLRGQGTLVRTLPHGAAIYDLRGQNVCMNACLTDDHPGHMRNLIFYPNGHLRYSWEHKGAILL